MEGYRFLIPYVGKRSKYKSFLAPLFIMPWLVLLGLWSHPDVVSSMLFERPAHLLATVDSESIDSPLDLQRALQQEIQESQAEIEAQTDPSVQQQIEADVMYLVQYTRASLMEKMDSTLATICYYTLVIFLFWSCVVWLLLNIHYTLIIFMPVIVLLLCCGVYPQWLFSWNRAITNLIVDVLCYFLQLTPAFPDVEAQDSIITLPQPHAQMSRWLPIVKWILVIPHSILLLIIFPVFLLMAFFGYISTVLVGKYPDSLYRFVEGYLRWNFRVISYSHLLVSDQYPRCSFFARGDS